MQGNRLMPFFLKTIIIVTLLVVVGVFVSLPRICFSDEGLNVFQQIIANNAAKEAAKKKAAEEKLKEQTLAAPKKTNKKVDVQPYVPPKAMEWFDKHAKGLFVIKLKEEKVPRIYVLNLAPNLFNLIEHEFSTEKTVQIYNFVIKDSK